MTDRRRNDAILQVPADVQERRSLRRAHPFVAVARVVGGTDALDVEIDHARRVCAVDEGLDPSIVQGGDDSMNGKDEGGRARHVIDDGEACAWSAGGHDGVDDLVLGFDGKGDLDRGHRSSRPFGCEANGIRAGVVAVVGDEKLISNVEPERAEHCVDGGGCVGYERQIVRVGAGEGGEILPGGFAEAREFVDEEADWLAFHSASKRHLVVEDRDGGGAERAVVQEGDRFVEEPVPAHSSGFRAEHAIDRDLDRYPVRIVGRRPVARLEGSLGPLHR